MHFSLLGSAVLIGLAGFGSAADNSCEEGPFAGKSMAGIDFPPNDPEVVCESKWSDGETIIGIEAWSAKYQLKAVRFKYSQSGWSSVRGSVPTDEFEKHQAVEWSPNDQVEVRLWNNFPPWNSPMDAVGRIAIARRGETIFEVGASQYNVAKEPNVVDSGAGIILGAKTKAGAWLSTLEFKMLKSKVTKVEMVQMEFSESMEDWNTKKEGIEDVSLDSLFFVNDNQPGGPNLTYTFTKTISRDETKTIMSQRTNQWAAGLKLTVSSAIKVPFLAEASASLETSFQYTRTNMEGEQTSTSIKKDLSAAIGSPATSGQIRPQTAAKCEAWAVTGKFDSPYTALIQATLEDGSKYNYKDSGEYNSVGWQKGSVGCKEVSLKDVPLGAQVQKPNGSGDAPAAPSAAPSAAPPSKRAVQFRG